LILVETDIAAPALKEFADQLDCNSLQHITSDPSPHADVGQHYTNVAEYITSYGGEKAAGFLFYYMPLIDDYVAFQHTAWKHAGRLTDITPQHDLASSRVFGESRFILGYGSVLLSEAHSNITTSYNIYVVRDRVNREILLTGLLKNFSGTSHPLWHVLENCEPAMARKLETMRNDGNIPEMITVLPNVRGPTKAETIVSKLSQYYQVGACYSYIY
jgi:hypothetical protein